MKKIILVIIFGIALGITLLSFFSLRIFNEVYGIKHCDNNFIKDYDNAILEKDIKFCKEDFFNRGYIGHAEPSCETNESKIINADTCMKEIIQRYQDIILCEEFYSIEECFSDIVNLSENPTWCDNLDYNLKLRCRDFIAKQSS